MSILLKLNLILNLCFDVLCSLQLEITLVNAFFSHRRLLIQIKLFLYKKIVIQKENKVWTPIQKSENITASENIYTEEH